jgi:tRNA nucleotidyltransferase (CCA-adding enzyme)
LICYEPGWTDAAVRRWLRRVGQDALPALYELNRADVLAKGRDASEDLAHLEALKAHVERVVAAGAAFSIRDLAIGGQDLETLGLRPGPIFGQILRQLLEEVLEDPARNEPTYLLSRAAAIAGFLPQQS